MIKGGDDHHWRASSSRPGQDGPHGLEVRFAHGELEAQHVGIQEVIVELGLTFRYHCVSKTTEKG